MVEHRHGKKWLWRVYSKHHEIYKLINWSFIQKIILWRTESNKVKNYDIVMTVEIK